MMPRPHQMFALMLLLTGVAFVVWLVDGFVYLSAPRAKAPKPDEKL